MKKYHVNLKGDAEICYANIKCPFGDRENDHFTNKIDALKSFENRNKINTLAYFTKQSGLKSDELLEKALSVYTRDYYAFAPRGSYLYGLETPKSDFDVTIIENGKKRPLQRIIGDFDYYTHSTESLLKALWSAELTEVDMLYSGKMRFRDNHFKEMFDGFNVSPKKYYARGRRWSEEVLKLHPIKKFESGRFLKDCRVSSRTVMLSNKFLVMGQDFNPVFSNEEKSFYYELIHEAESLMRKTDGDHIETTDRLLLQSFDYYKNF